MRTAQISETEQDSRKFSNACCQLDIAVRSARNGGGVACILSVLRDLAVDLGFEHPKDSLLSRSSRQGQEKSYDNSEIESSPLLHQVENGKHTFRKFSSNLQRCVHVIYYSLVQFFCSVFSHSGMRRYLQFSRKLFTVISAEWLSFFSERDRADCFDVFFLGHDAAGCEPKPLQAAPWFRVASLTALASALMSSQDPFTLQHAVRLLKVPSTHAHPVPASPSPRIHLCVSHSGARFTTTGLGIQFLARRRDPSPHQSGCDISEPPS